ncbi:dihydroflavonol 4-reductase-like [Malania oleifera]|uniref:dihydroflavonol 4-reductase-like n=1 Tax=Malania oleifera TaxID=397392 RepID=UPI0025AE08EE|nr:dihydroflavonol 4-reductase-like [Malania oleifera]
MSGVWDRSSGDRSLSDLKTERRRMEEEKTVCVTGASGFIASWLVKLLLERGYHVRAVVRDPENAEKVKHLVDLPDAKARLSLWKGDLAVEGSYDDAVLGCVGVFHLATPMGFNSSTDPENEIIKPTVDGVLNVLRSCCKAKSTLKRVVYTSSMAAVAVNKPPPPAEYDESFWTNVDVCRAVKMGGWSYFAAKTLGEKAAWEFAKENGVDLVAIQPPVVMGPFLTPYRTPSAGIALSLLTRNTTAYPLLMRSRAVHLDDVCNAHILLFEHPQAEGRFLCSSHTFTILDLAKYLKQKYPEYNIPTQFEGIDESTKSIPCSTKKLKELGFKFKYTEEECHVGVLFDEAINCCREKGLLPPPSANPVQ